MLFSMVHGRRGAGVEHADGAARIAGRRQLGIEIGGVSFSSSRTDATKSGKKTALIRASPRATRGDYGERAPGAEREPSYS